MNSSLHSGKQLYGPLDPPETHRYIGAPLWLTIILGVMCIFLIMVSGILSWRIYKTTQAYGTLEQKYDLQSQSLLESEAQTAQAQELMKEYKNNLINTRALVRDMQSEIDFWEHSAVLVTNYGECYHNYGCYHLTNRNVHILPIATAKSLGYKPCSDCKPTTLINLDLQRRIDEMKGS